MNIVLSKRAILEMASQLEKSGCSYIHIGRTSNQNDTNVKMKERASSLNGYSINSHLHLQDDETINDMVKGTIIT